VCRDVDSSYHVSVVHDSERIHHHNHRHQYYNMLHMVHVDVCALMTRSKP
jgi:hypothetical protein